MTGGGGKGNADRGLFVINREDLGRKGKLSTLGELLKGASGDSASSAARRRNRKDGEDEDDDDDDDDDDDQDEDEDDDEKSSVRRASRWRRWASKAVAAVKWLADRNRLTAAEKAAITSMIVENTANGEQSKAVIAYALLIEGLSKLDLDSDKRDGSDSNIDSDSPIDMNEVDEDDRDDFEQFCHRYAILGEN